MQVRVLTVLFVLLPLLPALALAGHESVPVGGTGLTLHDTAISQDRHYLKDDDALLDRIYTLMCDMDALLVELHALPAELADSPVAKAPVHGELLELIEIGLNHNPGLAPYRSEQGVLAARTRQAGAMQDPMAMFTLANFPAPQFPLDDAPMTQIVLGVSQKFESYGKRKLRRKIANIEEELKGYSLSQRELELVGQITDLYFDIVDTKSRLRVVDEHQQLLGLLVELGERKLALGLVPQTEVINAQLSLTELDEQQLKLESLLDKQQVVMVGLLGHADHINLSGYSFTSDYPLPVSILFDPAELLDAALELRPDYQRLLLMQDQQDYMVELAHRGFRPDYTITASYGVRWGKRDFVSAGISFPLFTNKEDRQDAKLQENYAMLAVTEDMQSEVVNTLRTRLAAIEVELDRLVDTTDLYRNALIPQARLALDSGIATFAADRLDLSELIKSQRQLENHEIELERLYIDYLRALSELQVLTAGAFDPLPYLEENPGALTPVGLDVLGYSLTEPTSVPPMFGNPGSGFIQSLDLPDAIEFEGDGDLPDSPESGLEPPVDEPAAPEPAVPEPAAPAELEDDSDEGEPDPAGFYKPFKRDEQEQ